ncbi:MAG: helicase-associated domain-containing protein [Gorillibacterium sp.]|nr:helicase-associated domain-containing protein [Gorillibacterium sp.]
MPSAPLLIRGERTLLLDTEHPEAIKLKPLLLGFAALMKSPGRLHVYQISSCSLWEAAASGLTANEVQRILEHYTQQVLPPVVQTIISREMARYGMLRLTRESEKIILHIAEPTWLNRFLNEPAVGFLLTQISQCQAEVSLNGRGLLKRELTRLGYPVIDEAGFHRGETLQIHLNSRENGFNLRPYQLEAVEAFCGQSSVHDGSGVVVLPCGSGKTAVGIAAMARLGCATLILTTNVVSVRQWQREIAEWTNLGPERIGEYSGAIKEVKPVTVATYQILTHRRSRTESFRHMQLFKERDWGLIIYDEVHLLPAPIFRATADIQATRRLGLTATLVREDGCEEDVFSLVGPKRFELPWKQLEQEGHIAQVSAAELRVSMPENMRERYNLAKAGARFRIAAENPRKLAHMEQLLDRHKGSPALVIGQYLSQLRAVAKRTGAPLITGTTPHDEREVLYQRFREGSLMLLIVSKVANFAVDLPQAEVAIELSGGYGSRQEEAQRLGRVMRPKPNGGEAHFYTLVSKDTVEQEYARNRQLFLLSQGYVYQVEECTEEV